MRIILIELECLGEIENFLITLEIDFEIYSFYFIYHRIDIESLTPHHEIFFPGRSKPKDSIPINNINLTFEY